MKFVQFLNLSLLLRSVKSAMLTIEKSDAIDTITSTAKALLQIIARAKECFTENKSTFIDEHIGILVEGLSAYASLYKKCGLKDQRNYEDCIRKSGRDLQRAAEELMEAEGELSSKGLGVVVVTFGCLEGARRWKEETKCIFPYYTNVSRSLYKVLNLRRSVLDVWDIKNVQFYGARVAQDAVLPQGYSDIADDPHQFGGDFMVNKEGRLILVHRSKTPSDRPSVSHILEALEKYITTVKL